MATEITATVARNRALIKMGLMEEGDTAGTNEATSLDAIYLEVFDELIEDQLAAWARTASIPNKFVDSLTDLMALKGSKEWRVPDKLYNRIVRNAGPEGEVAKQKIRKMNQPAYAPIKVAGEYM